MELFAIIAKVEVVPAGEDEEEQEIGGERNIVKMFLKQQLNQKLVEEYLSVFDQYLEKHQKISRQKEGKLKRTSVNSVKVLRICTDINAELTQKQKIVVLLRLLEFINAGEEVTDLENEFVSTVADTFNIEEDEFFRCQSFIDKDADETEDSPYLLYIDNQKEPGFEETKHIYAEGLTGQVRVLRIPSVNMYVFRYLGESELYLNGQVINPGSIYVLTHGSSFRSSLVQPIYYSDILNSFISDTAEERIIFEAKDVTYQFPNGGYGMHSLGFAEESGKLLGIMGGSGAGKSTLLNLLNGNYVPTTGHITINGIDIHRESDQIEGVIGYISQDDLLIEELTVFQNLFYNSKLCFDDHTDNQIARKVLELLESLGLYEVKDLKVGSPVDKVISGGQRKRLNIALELIREPSVLFVDEPTSGLSSRDSENIMDLLKELALKGKLVFVVIHQPSSDIFKMFDKLLILDQGGYPIYNGNPVDSVVYFKKQVDHINAEESECPTCGNVNPEQIFNIIESKVVDEFGNLTSKRKVPAEEWYAAFNEHIGNYPKELEPVEDAPKSTFKTPGVLGQFKIFFTRDVLSKFTNKQYLGINLLEAPVLAAILSFFVKYFGNPGEEMEYILRENVNLPSYLFIAVIVALFIGLTVSAEEIIRDQKIRAREAFLNLSQGSYLFSKISIMFMLSAVQMILYVVVGNLILEIKGMTFSYWLLLFSVSCFANMLGLNISASFNSAKVIYILIPLLIIPQLLFSGVIVSFDKLHPAFASRSGVPLIGNIMASRWAYEGLAVTQYKDNKFEKRFFEFDKYRKFSNWKKDFWVKALRDSISNARGYLNDVEKEARSDKLLSNALGLVRNEFRKELNLRRELEGWMEKKLKHLSPSLDALKAGNVTSKSLKDARQFLKWCFDHYKELYKKTSRQKEDRIVEMTKTDSLRANFRRMKDAYTNEKLGAFVTNKNSLTVILEANGELIQKKDPIYRAPYHSAFFDAHFYAPRKKLGDTYIDTFWANVAMIWVMSLILIVTLYFDLLRKLIEGLEKLKIPGR